MMIVIINHCYNCYSYCLWWSFWFWIRPMILQLHAEEPIKPWTNKHYFFTLNETFLEVKTMPLTVRVPKVIAANPVRLFNSRFNSLSWLASFWTARLPPSGPRWQGGGQDISTCMGITGKVLSNLCHQGLQEPGPPEVPLLWLPSSWCVAG